MTDINIYSAFTMGVSNPEVSAFLVATVLKRHRTHRLLIIAVLLRGRVFTEEPDKQYEV